MTTQEQKQLAEILQSWKASLAKGGEHVRYVMESLDSVSEHLMEQVSKQEMLEMQYQQNQVILKGVRKCVARTAGLKRKLQKYSLAQ